MDSTRPVVFVTTNANQYLGAKVAEHSFRAKAQDPELFELRLLCLEDYPLLTSREGQGYRRKGIQATWRNADLQSFTPLRFLPPQLLGYAGRALVVDPDVFAVSDVGELLARDMQGKAILCCPIERGPGKPSVLASSVMLLDCAQLTHWRWEAMLDELFAQAWDYGDWIFLRREDSSTIGLLEAEWNHFDRLTAESKLVHTTERSTQPWKTGLAIDFDTTWKRPVRGGSRGLRSLPGRVLSRAKRLLGEEERGRYLPHPDPLLEPFFFSLLAECLDTGGLTREELLEAISLQHLRRDALELVERYRAWGLPWDAPSEGQR